VSWILYRRGGLRTARGNFSLKATVTDRKYGQSPKETDAGHERK
jgi:hypothetical protein